MITMLMMPCRCRHDEIIFATHCHALFLPFSRPYAAAFDYYADTPFSLIRYRRHAGGAAADYAYATAITLMPPPLIRHAAADYY